MGKGWSGTLGSSSAAVSHWNLLLVGQGAMFILLGHLVTAKDLLGCRGRMAPSHENDPMIAISSF